MSITAMVTGVLDVMGCVASVFEQAENNREMIAIKLNKRFFIVLL